MVGKNFNKRPIKSLEETMGDIYQSNNDKNLNAEIVEEVITKAQEKRFNLVPHHPSTNSQIERPHATIKECIAGLQSENNKPWYEVVA